MEKDTIILAVPPKENQNRYNFKQMTDYCNQHNKKIEDLTMEEKKQFLVK